MYLLFYLKEPPVRLTAIGKLDKETMSAIRKAFGGGVAATMVDKKPAFIFKDKDSNVAYVKEISKEEYERLQKMAKEEMGRQAGAITRPPFAVPATGIPGRGFKKGRN